MIPEEVIDAVDSVVPPGVSHIGFVATNIDGEYLITEPAGHPYGVSATFSKVKAAADEPPSQALIRCVRQQVGQKTNSVFPIPAVWTTLNSTGYYFAGMLWNEGMPPSSEIPGLRWLSREHAEEKIRKSGNRTSRARDLGLLSAVADMDLSPYRRILLMVRELHKLGFERLRAPAYEYPLAWRCPVVPATWTHREHGGMFTEQQLQLGEYFDEAALTHTYSSATGQHPFGWTDVVFASPLELAKKFIRERREIAFAGWGPDSEYAEWFGRMLEMTGPNGLISAFSEYESPRDHLYALMAPVGRVPLPPPGLTLEEEFDDFSRCFEV